MGPFQEYEEKKSPEKGSSRSRIPRLVLHPLSLKDKGSPLCDSLLSEEEGKECDISSDHSKRTISTNSFCSDDTGCPTSHSVSPSKTSSGSEQSTHGSPVLPERKTKTKRVRMMAECRVEVQSAPRHKRELRSAMKARGSEADFSSSSSSGSLRTRETHSSNSEGTKTLSRSRGTLIRHFPVFKPSGVSTVRYDAELYAPCRTPPKAPPSNRCSSNSSSPTSRRVKLGCFHSCGDNHGIRPPNPEQYLTPLQQKEVAIRHLKSKLMESDNRVHDREAEIEDLKAQLSRMREDWIEEECHRVEAQLSLKEARKEIKQLRQVVETMKNSLMEKDKGIQKYFIDINIQNRKLESLLHSMELAQSGSTIQDEGAMEFMCDGPEGPSKKMLTEEEGGVELGNHGAEAMADSGLLVNDEMANRADIFDQVLMSTAVDFSQDSCCKPGATESGFGVSALSDGQFTEEPKAQSVSLQNPLSTTFLISSVMPCHQKTEHKEVQTDLQPASSDIQALLLQLLKFHGASLGDTRSSTHSNLLECPKPAESSSARQPDLEPSQPPATLAGPDAADPGVAGPTIDQQLDFEVHKDKRSLSTGLEVVDKSYWSSSYLVDLVAVAAPVLPTVAWMYSRHGVDGSTPVYNIGSLIRGCCIMGLHSLRQATHKTDV